MPFEIETHNDVDASWNRERSSEELQSFIASRTSQFADLNIEA